MLFKDRFNMEREHATQRGLFIVGLPVAPKPQPWPYNARPALTSMNN